MDIFELLISHLLLFHLKHLQLLEMLYFTLCVQFFSVSAFVVVNVHDTLHTFLDPGLRHYLHHYVPSASLCPVFHHLQWLWLHHGLASTDDVTERPILVQHCFPPCCFPSWFHCSLTFHCYTGVRLYHYSF